MKKILMAALPLTMMMAFGAHADPDNPPEPIEVHGGTINFEGSIVDAPCVVEVGSENSVVTMGQHRQSTFKQTGDKASPVDFNIKLSDCAVETYTNAALTFSGNALGGKDDVLALSSSGDANAAATGIGLQILQNDTPVKIDGSKATDNIALRKGDTVLNFQAQYISVANDVTSGSANSSAQFTVNYN